MKINIILMISLILLLISPIYSQSWRWKSLPDMPTARFGHCSVVYNNKVWNIGGKNQINNLLTSVDCYDLETGEWENNIPDLKHPRFNAAAVVYQDKIFVIGGQNGQQRLNLVEYYDPNEDQWKEFMPLLYPREGMNAVVFDGKLYVIGGLSNMELFPVPLDIVEFWDDSTQTWQESSTWKLQKPRVFMQSVILDSFVYTIGGIWIDEQLDLNERFGQYSGTESRNPLPSPRFYFSAVTVWEMIYVLGGIQSSDLQELHDSIDIYDPVLDQWKILDIPMTKPRSGLTAISYQNTIYVFGGMDSNLRVLQIAEQLEEFPTIVVTDNQNNNQPKQHQLLKNYPNPFNSVTMISFHIAKKKDQLRLVIFNLRGERVRIYDLNSFNPGIHQIQWDGRDENGRMVESGIYLAQLRSDQYHGPVLKLSFIK